MATDECLAEGHWRQAEAKELWSSERERERVRKTWSKERMNV